jgi:hypothetical protein
METNFLESLRAKLLGAAVPPVDLKLASTMPSLNPVAMERLVTNAWEQANGSKRTMEWIVRREGFYFDGPGANWTHRAITYAVCRDYLCWKTGKSERDINAELLTNNERKV